MGYTTDFTGYVTVEPPLNADEIAYLRRFADTRRMFRAKGPYYTGGGPAGQAREDDIIEYNGSPIGQPGLWCQWLPSDDGTRIEWDGGEKFRSPEEWMSYLIDTFLKPGAHLAAELDAPVVGRHYAPEFAHFTFNHVINGTIEAAGERAEDRWTLVVRDNDVERVEKDLANGDAAVRALIDDGWLGYPDDQITAEDLTRIVARVREADAAEVSA